MTLLLFALLFLLALWTAWGLSGYDPKVTGDHPGRDFLRRILRILATLALLLLLFGPRPAAMAGGYGFVPFIFVVPVSIGLLWCGCLSEWFSLELHRFLFFGGRGEFDPNKDLRELDHLAMLLKNGRQAEALQLAEQLKKSGDASVLTIETLLARAGIEWNPPPPGSPLAEVYRLRSQGNFAEAESRLNAFIGKNPSNVQASLLLIRLYAQDLKQPDQAAAALRLLEKQPDIPTWQIEYARRSLQDWGESAPAPPPPPLPESIEELLAQGYSGTAIEILEQKVKDQPADFDSWIKLAEAHGRCCHNLLAAEKIVRKIENSPDFSEEQAQLARTKLAEWRAGKPSGPQT